MEIESLTRSLHELAPGIWINSRTPISLSSLRGRVVLVNLWDFTCVHCLRTLPYIRTWYESYTEHGLTILGIHTPYFNFARNPDCVRTAIARQGIQWPVALDNAGILWSSFENQQWPGLYLLDRAGRLRFKHEGEGSYWEMEEKIQELLLEDDPTLSLPPMPPRPQQDEIPALKNGEITSSLYVDAIGNSVAPSIEPIVYEPPVEQFDGRFYLGGAWRACKDGLALVSEQGTISLSYHAATVFAVFSPPLHTLEASNYDVGPCTIDIEQDEEPLPKPKYAEDVFLDSGRSRVRIESPRTYFLVNNSDLETHILGLSANCPGLSFYVFLFGSR
jgi:thiol-disulfide isomerase/thioredoxin